MTLRITEENLLVRGELVVDLLVPAIPVQTAATIDKLQIPRRPRSGGRAHLVRLVPDAQIKELERDRIHQTLGNYVAGQRVARPGVPLEPRGERIIDRQPTTLR